MQQGTNNTVRTVRGNPFGYAWFQWFGLALAVLIIVGSVI